jgi:glycosyltransferase involved in cell wall biosynthesis
MRKLKVAFVMTHPVQYFAPWARSIAQHCPEIDLTVVYATEPTRDQQGVGFGRAFEWDIPLRDGYQSIVARPAAAGVSVGSDDFWSLDVPEIAETLSTLRPDVGVIAGWHSITQLRALRALRRMGVPVLYRGDSHLESARPGWQRWLSRARARRLLKQFDGYLVVGTRSREYLRWMGVPDPRLFDSPHAVDNEFFGAARSTHSHIRWEARAQWDVTPDDFVVLFAGKLIEKKRPLDVVRAVGLLGSGAALLVAGDGPLAAELRAEAARLDVRLISPGFLNQSEMVRAYAAADALALASDWTETWGLVVNEALAAGVPAVVSDRVGCAPDLVVPGSTGHVFPFGDVHALAARLEDLRNRIRGGDRLDSACRAHVSRWSFSRATEGLVRASRAVVQNRAPVRSTATVRVVVPAGHLVAPGGMEHMTFLAIENLIEQGAAVHCVLNSWDSHQMARLATNAGASWSVGYYWYPLTKTSSPVHAIQIAWDVFRCSADVLRAVIQRRATHILAPEELSMLRHAPALMVARVCGIPVILRQPTAPSLTRMSRLLWRHVISRLASRVVANSQFTRQELLRVGVPSSRVTVIRNIAPIRGKTVESPPRNPTRAIFVGQITPGKGVHNLLEAIALLTRRGVEVTLDVVGRLDGWAPPEIQAYRAQIIARASESDLADRVRLLGWQDAVPRLMGEACVHVASSLPELREAFGIVVLEAKAAGTPSVVVESGGLPELVRHRVDGWICADGSPEVLADGLAYFLSNPQVAARAGHAARESLSGYDRGTFRRLWASLVGLTVREDVFPPAPEHMTAEGR